MSAPSHLIQIKKKDKHSTGYTHTFVLSRKLTKDILNLFLRNKKKTLLIVTRLFVVSIPIRFQKAKKKHM